MSLLEPVAFSSFTLKKQNTQIRQHLAASPWWVVTLRLGDPSKGWERVGSWGQEQTAEMFCVLRLSVLGVALCFDPLSMKALLLKVMVNKGVLW